MVRITSKYGFFTSLWDNRPEPMLVALSKNTIFLFGDNYRVWVADKNGKIIEEGLFECSKDRLPYCLVEIKTRSLKLPKAYRNHWILAIGLIYDSVVEPYVFHPALPIRFFVGREPEDAAINPVQVEPIIWDDAHGPTFLPVGVLRDDDVEFRPAESVFAGKVITGSQ